MSSDRATGSRDRFTIGVDYGTLSGRAVVVRTSDGAELGSAVHDYPHGVMDTELTVGRPTGPGRRVALPADWALQVPHDYVEVLRVAVPAAVRAAGIDPASGHRHRHRLHGLHRAAGARRRDAAVRAAGVRRPAARLREALEAPRRPAARRPHQRARARAAASRGSRGTAASSPASGSSPRACSCSRRTRDLRAHGPLGRGGRLDRVAAVRHATSATPAPPATRGSGRTAPTPTGTSWTR